MKYIQKAKLPNELLAYLKTATKPAYNDLPGKLGEKWSEALLKEQGYVCAYTMKRISAGGKHMKREHLHPQNGDPINDLNHRNVVAVCLGNEGSTPKDQYADTRKGNRELHPDLHPTNKKCELVVKWRKNGEIYADDPELHKQLADSAPNKADSVLNLNYQPLVEGRHGAFEAVKRRLNQKAWQLGEIKRQIELFSAKDSDGRFREFFGFVLYRLQKELQWRSIP